MRTRVLEKVERIESAAASVDHDRRAQVYILAACVAVLSIAEIVAGFGLPKVSRTERRIVQEFDAAKHLRSTPDRQPLKVLVVGNSLLLDGVDFPALRRSLAPAIEAHRLCVEQTGYLDWYYGMRRLFADGSRPDVVVLNLNAHQLLSRRIRGDYSAMRLFRASDLLSVARDADLSPTESSSLIFGRFSSFFGSRVEIRSWLLSTVMPFMSGLTRHLVYFNNPVLGEEQIVKLGAPRLRAINELTHTFGARFVFLTPAMLGNHKMLDGLVAACHAASVPAVVPVKLQELPASEFSDSIHLNRVGAEHYTDALIPLLRAAVLTQQ